MEDTGSGIWAIAIVLGTIVLLPCWPTAPCTTAGAGRAPPRRAPTTIPPDRQGTIPRSGARDATRPRHDRACRRRWPTMGKRSPGSYPPATSTLPRTGMGDHRALRRPPDGALPSVGTAFNPVPAKPADRPGRQRRPPAPPLPARSRQLRRLRAAGPRAAAPARARRLAGLAAPRARPDAPRGPSRPRMVVLARGASLALAHGGHRADHVRVGRGRPAPPSPGAGSRLMRAGKGAAAAAPEIARDLALDPARLGILASAWFRPSPPPRSRSGWRSTTGARDDGERRVRRRRARPALLALAPGLGVAVVAPASHRLLLEERAGLQGRLHAGPRTAR